MTEDHIGVKIDGVIYVKLEDVKPMRDRIEKLVTALRLVAQNNYGLQSMMEDGTDTPEARAEYYAGQVIRRQSIARKALEGQDD